MPPLEINEAELIEWGKKWLSETNEVSGKKKNPQSFDRQQSVNFASFLDLAFGESLSKMLGNHPPLVVSGGPTPPLIPPNPDCVEVGPVRIIGGVRPQNYDAAFRPDGPRVVFDSKTLNDLSSVRKNWQNMVNDLATEATTVHTRFPYAMVVFMVVIPRPALGAKQEHDLILTLERLCSRSKVIDLPHLAESISLIIWDPETGKICSDIPASDSPLRLENLPKSVGPIYSERYKGLPPHVS